MKDNSIPPEVWAEVWNRDAGICQRPGCQKSGDELHHKIFRSQGGKNVPENLVLLCREHHIEPHENKKWDKYWKKWKHNNYINN